MSKVIVFEDVTLDGVMQAPGRLDEDFRGGFQHGGWATPYVDPPMGQVSGQVGANAGALLLGRRTYEDFYSVWPKRTDNPFHPRIFEDRVGHPDDVADRAADRAKDRTIVAYCT